MRAWSPGEPLPRSQACKALVWRCLSRSFAIFHRHDGGEVARSLWARSRPGVADGAFEAHRPGWSSLCGSLYWVRAGARTYYETNVVLRFASEHCEGRREGDCLPPPARH